MSQNTIKPWERQPGESDKAFLDFCRYRDMGRDRTLKQVANEVNKAFVTIAKLSERWKWVERAKAWTDYLELERNKAIVKEVQDMAKRHAKESQVFQKVLLAPVDALQKRMEKDMKNKDFEGIPLVKLFDIVLRSAQIIPNIIGIERTARGEPSDFTKQDITSNGEEIKVILPPITRTEEDDV